MTTPDPAVHRQKWTDDFNKPVPTGQCVCGDTWSPAHQGDSPGTSSPGEADIPPAVDLVARLDRVEGLVGRLLGAAANGFVDIAKGLVAAANETKEITLPDVLRARIVAEEAAHPLVVAGQAFAVGDEVDKTGGDYRFPGVVVAAFNKTGGARRYVVEDDRGILHIFSGKNLQRVTR